jgi:hypothetical protein
MKRINFRLDIKHKKANALYDTTTAFIILIIMTLIGVVGYMTLDGINLDFQASPDNDNVSKASLQSLTTTYPIWLDNVIVFTLVMFWITALIGAYMIDTHPVFFVVICIGLILLIGALAYTTNAFNEVLTSDDFLTYYGQLTKINFLMNNMLLVTVVMAFSILIVMVGKPSQ